MCNILGYIVCFSMAELVHDAYTLTPLRFGAEIHGINLSSDVSTDVIERIKHDVTHHRFLIFKDQGIVSGERQVEISKWFGELAEPVYRHYQSPHPDILRSSNSSADGWAPAPTDVGEIGWHVDGSLQAVPFAYSLYHIVSDSLPIMSDTGNI